MKIIITGAEEAGMEIEMIRNCEKLLELRINELPEIGDEYDILYSEKDPLMEADSDEVDDEAYTINFSVTNVEPTDGQDVANDTITMDLLF